MLTDSVIREFLKIVILNALWYQVFNLLGFISILDEYLGASN
jgi:hypothetical protein